MIALRSVIAVVLASLVSWMLSGSPVPLAFSTIVIALACFAKRITAKSRLSQILVAGVTALIFGILEWHLFRSGQAIVTRAETPLTLHFGMTLLWAAAILTILSSNQLPHLISRLQLVTGIAGGILLAASAAGTVLYDYAASQIFPIAGLPFTLFFKLLIFPSSGRKGSDTAAFVSILAVTTAVLFGSAQGTTYLYSQFSRTHDSDEEVIPQRPPDIGSNSGAMDGASRKIPREGNVAFDHKIRLYVKPHAKALLEHWAKGPLYFRTATLTRFESDEVIAPLRSGLWRYDGDDGDEDSTVNLLTNASEQAYPYSVFLDQKASLSLPLATETQSILTSAVYEFADNWFQLSPPKELPLFRFTARAGIRPAPGKLHLASEMQKESPYLSLPPSPLSAQVRKLTQSFDPNYPLKEVRSYLDNKAEYSLSFSTPENVSSIENFIFGDHKGHCEHYGAASVLMLRTMGVPSRLAYGYTGGAVDKKKSLFAFRDSDFHTWCEVLTTNRGWAIFDTVPETGITAPRYPSVVKVPAIDIENYHNVSDLDLTGMTNRPWIENRLNAAIAFLSLNFIPVLLVMIGIIGIAFCRLRLKKKAHDPSNGENRAGKAAFSYPQYLTELRKFGNGVGVSHSRGMTWKEFETQLAARIEVIPEVSRGIAYYYAVQFAGRERDPDIETILERRYRNWRKASSGS